MQKYKQINKIFSFNAKAEDWSKANDEWLVLVHQGELGLELHSWSLEYQQMSKQLYIRHKCMSDTVNRSILLAISFFYKEACLTFGGQSCLQGICNLLCQRIPEPRFHCLLYLQARKRKNISIQEFIPYHVKELLSKRYHLLPCSVTKCVIRPM